MKQKKMEIFQIIYYIIIQKNKQVIQKNKFNKLNSHKLLLKKINHFHNRKLQTFKTASY